MPKREDLQSILIIGAGPIVIGQGCEFDYSGAQACKALRKEGYRIILVNSNPATIMTDPSIADATYIEPIEWQTIAHIIEKEKPCALLPTMGGQTALNCALDLARLGILEKHNVEMIGAKREAIDKAEDREQFRKAMDKIGLNMPRSFIAHSMEEALEAQDKIGFPTIVRPSFTLGGSGGGIAYNVEEFSAICKRGLELSPTNELLIEQSIIGWKEFEMEVVRDKRDNCIIVCSIENLDAMGVHTGDSITVAPAQTLTDKEYQLMRDMSLKVLREIGVETGGSNVQFAVNPKDGTLNVIEMNPRVSRSSALASKATGFPIAKVAALLAIGYTLDELANEITDGQTPASFEPTIDYVVTKIPRFNFEKFPRANDQLTTQMKSVGEAMAIGRSFQESLQKAIRSLEVGFDGLDSLSDDRDPEHALGRLKSPSWQRLWYIGDAFRAGVSMHQIQQRTGIDPWFLANILDLIEQERELLTQGFGSLSKEKLFALKQKGFSDRRLAKLLDVSEKALRDRRHQFDLHPVYKRVDSVAGEFSVDTAYMYSTYEQECEATPSDRQKVMVLGGGPNRIGQGIEFDYCCVHAALAMKELGYETIMVNCNPETVSTDYDTSDRLFFEPLTLEDVFEIVLKEKPIGVIVQYGGQTPLKLAKGLEGLGVRILGTTPDAIDRAEDRERFKRLLDRLNLTQPPNETASTVDEAITASQDLGYPLVVRPSYVLGGRAMEIVYNTDELCEYMDKAVKVSSDSPILLDRFLDDAIEVDVDAVCDGEQVVIGGVMEHIEQAGIHSGDSSCSFPPFSLSNEIQHELKEQMRKLSMELGVVGLINAQFAVKNDQIFILEVNPRAARTVPFISKAIGQSLASIGAKCMVGVSLQAQGFTQEIRPDFFAVKKSVFPFEKFQGVDPILGPEMRSTGEVMGVGQTFGQAFAKSDLATGLDIPMKGLVFLSVRDEDKLGLVQVADQLVSYGYQLICTTGTANFLKEANIPCERINKVNEGRPHVVDYIKNGKITFIINTTEGRQAIADSYEIRRSAVQHKVNYVTTLAGARATVLALAHKQQRSVSRLQDLALKVSTV